MKTHTILGEQFKEVPDGRVSPLCRGCAFYITKPKRWGCGPYTKNVACDRNNSILVPTTPEAERAIVALKARIKLGVKVDG
jgi:hypothetical protein